MSMCSKMAVGLLSWIMGMGLGVYLSMGLHTLPLPDKALSVSTSSRQADIDEDVVEVWVGAFVPWLGSVVCGSGFIARVWVGVFGESWELVGGAMGVSVSRLGRVLFRKSAGGLGSGLAPSLWGAFSLARRGLFSWSAWFVVVTSCTL
jgi:hypothetical protein